MQGEPHLMQESYRIATVVPKTDWQAGFLGGDRAVLEACYREHYVSVDGALAGLLQRADRETVIHEVFLALLTDKKMRESFQGGSLGAWLRSVARNRAIDYLRRQRREQQLPADAALETTGREPELNEDRTHARRLLIELQQAHLPRKWWPVFEARFLRQLTQRETAEALGISRTTLAYQEHRVRRILRKHLLRPEEA